MHRRIVPLTGGTSYMAERAGARRTIEIPGASHAIAVSNPEATADLILEATAMPAAA